MPNTLKRKIATLPAEIREEVNRRLYDGETAKQIIKWLHQQPDVLRVLDEQWNNQPINRQNICKWRQEDYAAWLEQKELARVVSRLSNA